MIQILNPAYQKSATTLHKNQNARIFFLIIHLNHLYHAFGQMVNATKLLRKILKILMSRSVCNLEWNIIPGNLLIQHVSNVNLLWISLSITHLKTQRIILKIKIIILLKIKIPILKIKIMEWKFQNGFWFGLPFKYEIM